MQAAGMKGAPRSPHRFHRDTVSALPPLYQKVAEILAKAGEIEITEGQDA